MNTEIEETLEDYDELSDDLADYEHVSDRHVISDDAIKAVFYSEIGDVEDEYMQGMDARANGLSKLDNPYSYGTRQRSSWNIGWSAGLPDTEDEPYDDVDEDWL